MNVVCLQPLSHHAEQEVMDFHDEATMVAYRRSDIKTDMYDIRYNISYHVNVGNTVL